jgi:hypothetical protein
MEQWKIHINHARPCSTLSSAKRVIGPSAEGVGKCAGANDGAIAPENQRQPLGVTKRPCWSVVGRLFDLLDKEIGLDGRYENLEQTGCA